MAVRVQLVQSLVCLAALVAPACTNRVTEDPQDAGSSRAGRACTADGDCGGLLCLGGVCATPSTGSGSSAQGTSSSGGTSTSGTSMGGSLQPSSGQVDAGTPDAFVPTGTLTTQPASGPLDFGGVRLGVSVEKTVLLTNTGEGTLSLLATGFRYVDATAPAEFSITDAAALPPSLEPGAQVVLHVVYTPVRGEGNDAFLTIATSDPALPVKELELIAGFKGDPALAVRLAPGDTGSSVSELTVAPTPLGSSNTAHLYLMNSGAMGSALVINTAALTAASTSFTVDVTPLPRSLSPFPGVCSDLTPCSPLATACTAGLCVMPGTGTSTIPVDVVDVAVTFQASSPGIATASLAITAQGHGQMFNTTVNLRGTAQVGGLVATPNPMNVGTAFPGYPTRTQLRIQNAGNTQITLDAVDFMFGGTPPPFSVDLGSTVLPRTLNPSSSFNIQVVFNPPDIAGFGDTLVLHPANGAVVTVPLTGEGVEKPSIIVPAELDFGDRQVMSAKVLDVAIRNGGPGILNVTRLSVSATGTSPFTFSPSQVAAPLQPNQSTTVQVTYAPQFLSSSDTATLVVESNDAALPVANVVLKGRPIGPLARLNPPAALIEFGEVPVGVPQPPSIPVTITNAGVGPLTVSGDLIVRDAQARPVGAFAVMPDRSLPTGVEAGGTDALTLQCLFNPTANGPISGTLRVNTNDPAQPQLTITVTGTGVACSGNHVPMPTFSGGMCTGVCEDGFNDCDANKLTNGCESEAATDPAHCGACDKACSNRNVTPSCGAGICNGVCNSGYGDCNSNKQGDGCETDILSTVAHCGACGQACSANNITSPMCAAGACVGACDVGFGDCNMDRQSDGCEKSVTADALNCGGCGKVCSNNNLNNPTCAASVCTGTCNVGFGDCDSDKLTNGCELDVTTSADHCGGCGMTCSGNHVTARTCADSLCVSPCAANYKDCNMDRRADGCETRVDNNNANCGLCGKTCSVTSQCVAGVCQALCGVKVNELQTGSVGNSSNEFVELYNTCPFAIDVSNYKLFYRAATGNSESSLLSGPSTFGTNIIMPAGGYLVFAGSGFSGSKLRTLTSGLKDTGAAVGVRDEAGQLVDSVAYDAVDPTNAFIETAVAPNPPTSASPGNSIQRIPNGADSDDNSVDFQIRAARTPGLPNQ